MLKKPSAVRQRHYGCRSRVISICMLAAQVGLGVIVFASGATAADPTVTHVVADNWQSTDFHDTANPGCSIGGAGSVPGSRLMMGANRSRPDPMNMVIRKAGWRIPNATLVFVRVTFADTTVMEFPGQGRGQNIEIDVTAGQLRTWVHGLTANSSMQISFGGNEPPWSFDLTGTSAVINAMGDCFQEHDISGVAAPFSSSGTANAGTGQAPFSSSTQPFGTDLPPQAPVPAAQFNPPFMPQSRPSTVKPAGSEAVVAQWGGTTELTTRPFQTNGPWELQWSTEAGFFHVYLHDASNPEKTKLITAGSKASSSSSYQPVGGSFYLEFSASQQWTAKVVAIPQIDQSISEPVVPAPIAIPPTIASSQTDNTGGQPPDEQALLGAVSAARQQYQIATNDMSKGAARPLRAKAICRVIPSPTIRNWVGTIDTLSTNGEGKGVVSIKVADGVQLKTWNNALSDISDHTLIDPNSRLFATASSLHPGQAVQFSAQLIPDPTDCFREGSLTMNGSINEPEFIMRLTTIASLP